MKYFRVYILVIATAIACIITVLVILHLFVFRSATPETPSAVDSVSEVETSSTKTGNSLSEDVDLREASELVEELPLVEEPVVEVEEERFLILNGREFNQLFADINLDNLSLISSDNLPYVTGDIEVDGKLRKIAEDRGYQLRPQVADLSLLVAVEGYYLLQPKAAEAYLELKAAAAAAGHNIHISSAFRSHDTQRSIFLNHLAPPYAEEAVREYLRLRSLPGYSKHHSGYVIDIGQGELTFQKFATSSGYAWLSADNYLNAKRYGWIPSYPPDGGRQGPDPEPWEFVYVGRQFLLDNDSPGS